MEDSKNAKSYEKTITPRATDYNEWYLDVISAADLAEHSPVKGCMIIKPNGYAIWEGIQKVLDVEFKRKQVRNAYFPMLIPERLLKQEESHVEGFAPEVAVVTHAGGEKLEEPYVLRPTSETIMYDVFSKWVRSYRDLPLLINQWANVIRWELRTKLFLRTTEFLWQEGHTVHKTPEEADAFAREMLEVYKNFFEKYMAIPIIPGMKSESEKFAGALKTYTCEAMMQDGKALQIATSHNLGDHFAKAFNVQFLNEQNTLEYGHQTSWGLSTRSIGGLIMTHSDDKGLVLPPNIAPIKIVIVPITNESNHESIVEKAKELETVLKATYEFGVTVDARPQLRPGEKYFKWEKEGVPLRIEYGPKDIENNSCVLVRRDTGEKVVTQLTELQQKVAELLNAIQENLLQNAKDRLIEKKVSVDTWESFVSTIEQGQFVLAHWDGTAETEKLIKEETGATIRCIPFDSIEENGVCIKSGNPSTKKVLFAKAY